MVSTASATEIQLGETFSEILDDYTLSLHAAGKSKATRTLYRLAVEYLDAYLAEQGMPRSLTGVRREHIKSWLVSCAMPDALRPPSRSTTAPPAVLEVGHWRRDSSRTVRFATSGGPRCQSSRCRSWRSPKSEALLKACAPRHRDDFEGFRDTALVTLLATTGIADEASWRAYASRTCG